MKNLNKNILMNLEHEKRHKTGFATITDPLRLVYYKNLYDYYQNESDATKDSTPFTTRQFNAAVKNLTRIMRLEAHTAHLLISELSIDKELFYHAEYGTWFIYLGNEKGYWKPATLLKLEKIIYEKILELYPSTVALNFNITKIKALSKILSLKVAQDFHLYRYEHDASKLNFVSYLDNRVYCAGQNDFFKGFNFKYGKLISADTKKPIQIISETFLPELFITTYLIEADQKVDGHGKYITMQSFSIDDKRKIY